MQTIGLLFIAILLTASQLPLYKSFALENDLTDLETYFVDSERPRSKREAIVVNDLADPILKEFRKKLLVKNENVVPINNFTKSLTFGVFGTDVTYMKFKGYNAKIKDISTIYRIGDVTLKKDNVGLTVRLSFGFWTLEYTCDSYLLKLTMLKFSGNLRVAVDESEVFFEATVLRQNGTCRFEVKALRVVKLNGIQVKVTGFSVLDSLMSKVVARVLEYFKDTIKKTVEEQLVNSLTEAIEKTGVCKEQHHDG